MSLLFLYVGIESVTKRGKEIEGMILAKVNSEDLNEFITSKLQRSFIKLVSYLSPNRKYFLKLMIFYNMDLTCAWHYFKEAQ